MIKVRLACNIFFEYYVVRGHVLRSRDASIRSRTDIKISSFHEDSRNKDCKKVWNEPRALLRAHISRPFPFSFSPSTSLARSFFFYFSLCISLSFWRCKGAGVAAVYEYSRSPRQWNDERHPRPTSPPLDAQPRTFRRHPTEKKSLTLGFLPRFLHANRTIGSLNFRERRDHPRSHLSKSSRRYWQLT